MYNLLYWMDEESLRLGLESDEIRVQPFSK